MPPTFIPLEAHHVTVVILLVQQLGTSEDETLAAGQQRDEVLVVEEKLGILESEVAIHLHGPRRHRLAVDRALTILEKRLELDLRDVEVGGRTAILDHFETLRDEVGEPLKLEAEVGEPTLDDELESPLEELGVVGVTPFLAQLPFDLRDLPVDLVAESAGDDSRHDSTPKFSDSVFLPDTDS